MTMKKLLIVAIALLVSGPALALAGIANTPHNLGSTQLDPALYGSSATNEDEICIFCHTPHGGTLDAPLWNRIMPNAAKYTQYTSAALTKAGVLTARPVNPESLVCLSCHDGSLAFGDIINPAGPAPDNTNMLTASMRTGFSGGPGPRIGGSRTTPTDTVDLSDDHPISFSYTAVDTANPGTLHPYADVETAGLKLYGTGTTKNVECSTCHDPHVDYLAVGKQQFTPFLAMSNAGSAMCLTCHIK